MPYQIIRNDITTMHVDAIVNPTDWIYSGSGGTDEKIHLAAGEDLRRACDVLPPLETGEAIVTDGFRLPCRYVIHTIGPIWTGGDQNERETLIACYRNCLRAAFNLACETVAFPLIASGTFGYPKDQVLRVALETIAEFLMAHEMTVYIVVYDKESYAISKKLHAEIESYIDENYIENEESSLSDRILSGKEHSGFLLNAALPPETCLHAAAAEEVCAPEPKRKAKRTAASLSEKKSINQSEKASLDSMLASMDEGFSSALFRWIDAKGMTDVECYKKANIDKKLFSKIRNPSYRPSKPTILAFAVALELTLEETKALLETAGLALSRSSRFDVIVSFFISNGKYDLWEINETLYQYDLPCLGNVIA